MQRTSAVGSCNSIEVSDIGFQPGRNPVEVDIEFVSSQRGQRNFAEILRDKNRAFRFVAVPADGRAQFLESPLTPRERNDPVVLLHGPGSPGKNGPFFQ